MIHIVVAVGNNIYLLGGNNSSNYKYNISIVIVGYGSNDNEFMNTLVHEARHVE